MEKIRLMENKDLDACARIIEEAYSKDPYNETFSPGSALKFIDNRFSIGKGSSFVMEKDGKVKGFIISSVAYWSAGPQAIIEEIAVSEDSLRKGYATKLNDHLERHLKSIGVRSAMLWTKKGSPAMKFHEHNKYQEAKDVAVMFKILE